MGHADSEKKIHIADLDVRGLTLRVAAEDHNDPLRVFYVRLDHHISGKRPSVRLGRYPNDIPDIETARRMAIKLQSETYQGKLPKVLREFHGGPTVAEMFEFYWTQKGFSENAEPVSHPKKYVLPLIGSRPVRLTSRKTVGKMLNNLLRDHGPTAKYKALSYLRAAWELALDQMEDFEYTNVCIGIKNQTFTPLAVVVTPEQYAALYRTINRLLLDEKSSNEVSHMALLAIKLISVTGHRRGEVSSIRLDHLTDDHVKIPYNKSNDPDKIIYRTEAVDEVIEEALDLREGKAGKQNNPYLFPSMTKGGNKILKGHCYDASARAMVYLRKCEPLLEGLNIRDLRSGASSVGRSIGMSDVQIADVTQHADPSTLTRYYARSSDRDKRASAEKLSAEIARLMRG